MQRTMKLLILGVCLFSLAGSCAWAQAKIATVNLQKVFDKYYKTDQVTAALKEKVADLEKSHKEMLDDWKKAKEQYQKLLEDANNQAVSAEERDRRKKSAEEKLGDIKSAEDSITAFERQAAVSINEQKARMRKSLLDDIKRAIESKAQAGNYSLVIDSGAQTYAADPSGPYYTPTVLFANDSTDLTEAVLAQLNAAAPITPAATTDKPVEPKAKK